MRFLRCTSVLVLLIVAIVAALGIARWALRPRPSFFARSPVTPEDAREAGGAWYWVERPSKQPQRLVRADQRGITVLAADDAIIGFDVEDRTVAWAARHGKAWLIGRTDGGAPEVHSSTPIGTPCLWNGRVYWASDAPARVDPSIPLPAVGPFAQVCAEGSSGRPNPVAAIPGIRASIVGHTGNDLFVVATEGPDQGSMAIYRVPLDGSPPRRVAAETEIPSVAVAPDGTLFWAAPSRDSSERASVACVCRMRGDRPIEVVQDWLPAPGAVYVTGGRAWYVARLTEQTAWQLASGGRLPRKAPIPEGFGVLAAGERNLLLRSLNASRQGDQLYLLPHS